MGLNPSAVNTTHQDFQKLLGQLQEIQASAKKAREATDADIAAIKQSSQSLQELETAAKTQHESLKKQQQAVQGKAGEIDKVHTRITELSNTLLVDAKDENGALVKKSLKTEIDELQARLNNEVQAATKAKADIQSEFKTLKASLEAEIRSLLPNAAAAALAHGYVESKARYGLIPYDERSRAGGSLLKKLRQFLWHYIKGSAPSLINYAFLILPLAGMTWLFFDLFKDTHDPDLNSNVLMFRTLIAAPLVAMAIFGWKSISINRRLYEEYNHKQRVMQLYHGFKQEVEKSGNSDELKKALLAIMLSVVQDKPSLVMKDYDRTPDISFPAVNLGSLLSLKEKSP